METKKISKGWFVFHLMATLFTGGFWLIPLAIWYMMNRTKR